MPVRKITFEEDGIYHVYNRGVEKRTIFLDNRDYFRAIHDLYEFNDERPATLLYYKKPFLESYETRSHRTAWERKPIVEILAFVLMPNHYHLLLRQLKDGGVTEFMQRFGVGYAMYFNQRYQRTGRLFEAPFKAVRIEREAHFLHLPFYIHANPLDLKFPEWRERRLRKPHSALQYLKSYRWSSFPDYVGIKNFPSVTTRSFLTQVFGTPKSFGEMTLSLLKEVDFVAVEKVALESLDSA